MCNFIGEAYSWDINYFSPNVMKIETDKNYSFIKYYCFFLLLIESSWLISDLR